MRAYGELYVGEAQRRLGSMLDFAVCGCGVQLGVFYRAFLQSEIAARFGEGEPSLIVGQSGTDLAISVLSNPRSPALPAGASFSELDLIKKAAAFTPIGGASPEYWTGWALAYYQWETARTFAGIERLIPIERVAELYHPYHEMDITQFCDVMDELCLEAQSETNLQKHRLQCGMSQGSLAQAASVPVRTIQQYEQRQKDINKAQVKTVVALARVLHCEVTDLMEYSSSPHYEYEFVRI